MMRKMIGAAMLCGCLISGCASRMADNTMNGIAAMSAPSWNPITTDGVWRANDGSSLTVTGDQLALDAGCGVITLRRMGGEGELGGIEGLAYRVAIEAAESPPADAQHCREALSPGNAVVLVQGMNLHPEFGVQGAVIVQIFRMMEGDMIDPSPVAMIGLARPSS